MFKKIKGETGNYLQVIGGYTQLSSRFEKIQTDLIEIESTVTEI